MLQKTKRHQNIEKCFEKVSKTLKNLIAIFSIYICEENY